MMTCRLYFGLWTTRNDLKGVVSIKARRETKRRVELSIRFLCLERGKKESSRDSLKLAKVLEAKSAMTFYEGVSE